MQQSWNSAGCHKVRTLRDATKRASCIWSAGIPAFAGGKGGGRQASKHRPHGRYQRRQTDIQTDRPHGRYQRRQDLSSRCISESQRGPTVGGTITHARYQWQIAVLSRRLPAGSQLRLYVRAPERHGFRRCSKGHTAFVRSLKDSRVKQGGTRAQDHTHSPGG